MAPRANWKGYLRLSLVSCPIALYPASSMREKVGFNRINRKTGNRRYGNGMLNGASYNDPRKFLQTHEYNNLTRWTKEIGERPAVKRGRMVNRTSGPLEEQLHERHDANDFETRTQDKVGARG